MKNRATAHVSVATISDRARLPTDSAVATIERGHEEINLLELSCKVYKFSLFDLQDTPIQSMVVPLFAKESLRSIYFT